MNEYNVSTLTCNTSSKAAGRTSSTAPMSLENLFSMRPEGLVWKKRMGARVMAANMLLWRRVEASIAMEKNMNDRRRDTTTSANTIAEIIHEQILVNMTEYKRKEINKMCMIFTVIEHFIKK